MVRIGFGYDAHRLVPGKKLVLGGIRIPFDRGLDGHSDADVLIHAVVDAIIGALGRGDIGTHFPDNDQSYEGAESTLFLMRAAEWMREQGYILVNLDATVVAQRPRLSPHMPAIRERLSSILNTEEDRVNIKAKTTEGMGFCGREEGIAAYAVVSLLKNPSL